MKISVITPTSDRPHFLEGLYTLLKNQTHTDWEWLIYDSSLHPQTFADRRVVYFHDHDILTIGEKRNRLLERATGEGIAHFDDDDYYAPTYLAHIAKQLEEAAFYNYHSWFSHDLKSSQTYYWATDEQANTQYIVNALSGSKVREIELGSLMAHQEEKLNYRGRTGFGFSFSYRKEVAEACHFPDVDFAEDRAFYEEALEKGFSLVAHPDREGRVVHLFHDTNTSTEYPQYRIPLFLSQQIFPEFFSYLERFTREN
ncbi:MAG: hypothetical protein K940chlam9_00918 [Chlamydiae bacterium]|nr:hypothetical protein [Chlamydiota bacterium]